MFGSFAGVSRVARIVLFVPLLGLMVSECGIKTIPTYEEQAKRGVEDIIQVLGRDSVGLQQRIAENSAPDITPPAAPIPVWLAIVLAVGGIGLLIFCAVTRGAFCQAILQILLLMLFSGRRSSSHGGSSWSGGGGSFGGGGASGRW